VFPSTRSQYVKCSLLLLKEVELTITVQDTDTTIHIIDAEPRRRKGKGKAAMHSKLQETKDVKVNANGKAPKQSQVQDNGMSNSALCFSNEVELTIAVSGKEFHVGETEALQVDAKPKGVKGKGKGKVTMHTQGQGKGMLNSGKSDILAQSMSFADCVPFSNKHIGKRKRDNAPEPARGSQQTTKKLKTRHTGEHLVEQSRVEHIDG
jgi:hypothetical protein